MIFCSTASSVSSEGVPPECGIEAEKLPQADPAPYGMARCTKLSPAVFWNGQPTDGPHLVGLMMSHDRGGSLASFCRRPFVLRGGWCQSWRPGACKARGVPVVLRSRCGVLRGIHCVKACKCDIGWFWWHLLIASLTSLKDGSFRQWTFWRLRSPCWTKSENTCKIRQDSHSYISYIINIYKWYLKHVETC